MDLLYFGYIYKFTDLTTDKIYVGKRQKCVFDELYFGSGKLWVKVVSDVGRLNIKREILLWCYSKDELIKQEIFWIKELNSTNRDIGYNIHKGGNGGNQVGDTLLWSEMHKGSKNGRFGKEVSKETRAKISKANTGKIRTEEFKEQVSKVLKGRKKPEGFGDKVSIAQKGRKRSETELLHVRDAQKITALKNIGNKIYNNGINEIRMHEGDDIPEGFTKGRLKSIAENARTNCNLPKNFKWFNNGLIAVYREKCPDGFVPGRKLR